MRLFYLVNPTFSLVFSLIDISFLSFELEKNILNYTMMRFKEYLLLTSIAFLLFSCKKTEEVQIEGNVAPPDLTVENVIVENYINKLYISLLGRKATDQEFNEGLQILENDDLSAESRISLIQSIQERPDYYIHEYEIARAALLNGLDTNTVYQYINILNEQLDQQTDPEAISRYNEEIQKLEDLVNVTYDLESNSIQMKDVHQRCVRNFFYDEINMGTENFIVSIYQNFFFRYPSNEELSEATKVIDGLQGIVFYEIASGKDDFISLFTESNEYLEGQVRDLYLRYLFREPQAAEMAILANQYKDGDSFETIQQKILSSDEYVGI